MFERVSSYRGILYERYGVETCKALTRRRASGLLTRLGRWLKRAPKSPKSKKARLTRLPDGATRLVTREQRELIAVLAGVLHGILRGLRDPGRIMVSDDEARAWIVAMSICDELHPFGPVILPSRVSAEQLIERDARVESIWEEFDGWNCAELAAKHRLTVRQVRRIVERWRRGIPGG